MISILGCPMPAPAPPKVSDEEIEKMMAQHLLEKGLIRCVVPDTMKTGESYRVIVNIKKGLNIDFEKFDLDERYYRGFSPYERKRLQKYIERCVSVDTIEISSYVEVDIKDPKEKFNINPLFTHKLKTVDSNALTEWEWEISPIEYGDYPIIISASTRVFDGYKENFKEFKVFEKKIVIHSNIKKSIIDFIKKYWQWIFATLVIPTFLWLRKEYFKKKNREKPREHIGFKTENKKEGSK